MEYSNHKQMAYWIQDMRVMTSTSVHAHANKSLLQAQRMLNIMQGKLFQLMVPMWDGRNFYEFLSKFGKKSSIEVS